MVVTSKPGHKYSVSNQLKLARQPFEFAGGGRHESSPVILYRQLDCVILPGELQLRIVKAGRNLPHIKHIKFGFIGLGGSADERRYANDKATEDREKDR